MLFQFVGRQEMGIYRKLEALFDNDRNWERLRKHLGTMKVPCIPYLGIFHIWTFLSAEK